VFHQFDAATFQVGYRFAAARSARLQVDVDFAHFFLTHQASAALDATGWDWTAHGTGVPAISAIMARMSGVQVPPQ
jgi:hypothetical protein